MRLAFVGGTRFIGHAAAARALAMGHEVVLLHRGVHPSSVVGAREIVVDRADASALRAALEDARADVVVDTRAMNAVEASTCASAVAALALPVLVLSSQDVYAQFGALNGHPCPVIEEQVGEISPLTVPYPFRGIHDHEGGPTYDKKDVEATFAESMKRGTRSVVILRLPAVYGRRDPQRRFGDVVDALDAAAERTSRCTMACKEGAPFRWTHVHVDDAAHAIVLAAEVATEIHGALETFNVGEDPTPTMRERIEAIARAMNVALSWEETVDLPDALSHRGPQPNDFVADTRRIRDRLGFREITTEASRLADLVAWLRETRAR